MNGEQQEATEACFSRTQITPISALGLPETQAPSLRQGTAKISAGPSPVLLRLERGGVSYRFVDTCQDLLCSGEIREGLASSPPALAAIHINEQNGIQRDVAAVDAAGGV